MGERGQQGKIGEVKRGGIGFLGKQKRSKGGEQKKGYKDPARTRKHVKGFEGGKREKGFFGEKGVE